VAEAKKSRSRGAVFCAREFGRAFTFVIARSQRVRPEVAGPMTGSATKQSSTAFTLDCFASLAMTARQEKAKDAERRQMHTV
jgi:hypothetical protein